MSDSPLIYIASSWKNTEKLDVVHVALQKRGLRTWDFRKNGFWWKDVDEEWLRDPMHFPSAPQSLSAFRFDKEGLDRCFGVFALLPAGISTAIEVGYAAGKGKPVLVYGQPREDRCDIMWNFARRLVSERDHTLEEAVRMMCDLVTPGI